MITSENVPSEAQAESFFLFHRKVMFRSQDIQVSVFLTTMIYQICDVMISIRTWDMGHF